MIGVPFWVAAIGIASLVTGAARGSSLGHVGLQTPNNHDDPVYHCSGIGPQESLVVAEMEGMWFAVELVHHRYDSKLPRGESVVHTCPVLHLSLTREGHDRQGEPNGIRLIWREDVGSLVYNFNVDLANRPGFWISSGAQNGNSSSYWANPYGNHGTLALPSMNTQYRQFAGTVEVTKAVGSHMVLTFCMPGQQLFSIVMARQKSLPLHELRGVNSLLERKGLTRVSTRQACRNGASQQPLTLQVLALLALSIVVSIASRT